MIMEDFTERLDIDWELIDTVIQDIEGTGPTELFDEDLLQNWNPEEMIEGCSGGEANNLTIRAVDILLQDDGNVNQRDTFGNTALHNELLQGGSLELIECLLDRHADVNATGYFQHSPLQLAVLGDVHLDVISTLIRHGANINHKDISGQTVLHTAACKRSNKQLLQLLLDNGADVSAKDLRGQTPLHLCSRSRITENVKMLLNHGASASEQDEEGQTPLHLAFIKNPMMGSGVENALLKHGANEAINIQDARGRTPIHLAATLQYSGIILRKMLNRYNDSMAILDNDGNSPVELAIKNPRPMRVFTHHALKLKCANLPVEANYEFDFSHSSHQHSRYLKELDMMKLHKFGNYSLYDIFSKSHDPVYLNNKMIAKGIQTAVESPDLKKEFPSYKYLLRETFYKRRHRLFLLNRAQESFPAPLPFEMRRLVLSYLSDLDLENWITAQRLSNRKSLQSF